MVNVRSPLFGSEYLTLPMENIAHATQFYKLFQMVVDNEILPVTFVKPKFGRFNLC